MKGCIRTLVLLLMAGFSWLGQPVARAEVQDIRSAQIQWLASPGTTQDVALPFFYRADSPLHEGAADFRMTFDIAHAKDRELPVAVFMPMISGNATLRVNGVVLERFGAADNEAFRQTRVPQALTIPQTLLKEHNELALRIEGGRVIRGVPQLRVGDYAEIMEYHARELLLSVGGRFLGGAFAFFVALTSLVLWWTQVRVLSDGSTQREAVYLYGAIAESAWTLRVAEPMIEGLLVPTDWRLVASSVSVGLWTTFVILQCLALSQYPEGGRVRWFRLWLWLELGLGVVASIVAWVWHRSLGLSLWYAANLLTMAAFSLSFSLHAWKQKLPWSNRVLSLTLFLNVVAAAVDFVHTRIMGDYSVFNWLYLSSAVLGLAMVVMVVQRFREARRQADELSHTLERRVRQREAELVLAQQTMSDLLQDQARTVERSRIMKNMHDGVGSHLSMAMHQLSSDGSDRAVVLDTLREGMDHLKLSVDIASIDNGDVVALLCNLRHRLEPRLQGAGIRILWDVADFEPPPALKKRDLSALLYVLYEIVSNVLQHAHATQLQVHCSRSDDQIHLRLQDNGIGFVPDKTSGRGLRIIQSRLAELGAQVAWQSAPGATAVTITLGPA